MNAKHDTAFWTVKATKNGRTVLLTFDDEGVARATRTELRRKGYDVELNGGYVLFCSVEIAVRTAQLACNDL